MEALWIALLCASSCGLGTCVPVRKEVGSISPQDTSFPKSYYSLDKQSPRRRKRHFGTIITKKNRMEHYLDPEKLQPAKKPGCGVPDVANFELSANKSKWQHMDLTYSVLNYTNKLRAEDVDRAIAQALKTWSDVTPLNFSRVDHGDADITITFATKDHGDFFPFDGPRGVLAHAFGPGEGLGGDVHLDEEEFWTMGYVKKGYDLFSVVAHELGHALGLGHSKDPNALMHPKYKYFEPSTYQLSLDDIVGIQALYGPPDGKAVMGMFPEVCDPLLSFDSATTVGSGVLLLKDGYMWLRNPWGVISSQGFIQSYFPKIPPTIDAAFEVPHKMAVYLLAASTYWIIDSFTLQIAESSIVDFGFPATVAGVDAAVYLQNAQKTLFFVGQEYWSYDEFANVMEIGYPKQIKDEFPGINNDVNAAFESAGILYLLVGPQLSAYNYDERNLLFTTSINAWLGC